MDYAQCRQCKACGILKPFTGEFFHLKLGKPIGKVCRACLNIAQNNRRKDPTVRLAVNKCSKDYWNKHKKERATKNNEWKKRNRGKANFWERRRELAQLQRTPGWVDIDEAFLIAEAYALATLRSTVTGIAWHVDHVIPLRGKTVSGLHVPLNLAVIPAIDNIRKRNNYEQY